MKVLGYTEEITTCDCCGKRNLKGSFAIETDAGDEVYYGSVCVNKVYGKGRGEKIKMEAKHIQRLKSATWETAVDLYSRGILPCYIRGVMNTGKGTWNNSPEQMAAIIHFKHQTTGEILKTKD